MALITCPECNKEISQNAATCPSCGNPQKTTTTTTTIQESSKALKKHILLSSLLFTVGILWIIAVISTESNSTMGPVLTTTAGLVWFLATKFKIWWHHK